MQARTQRSTYELLGAYRCFALAVAALQVVLAEPASASPFLGYIILGVLGLYSLIRLFLPYYRGFRDGYLGLAVDVGFSTVPLFLTGGLTSPFLFYSLCPIIYGALVFPRLVALSSAIFISLCLVVSLYYPVASQVNFGFAGIYVTSQKAFDPFLE